jgi:hypothetical protein
LKFNNLIIAQFIGVGRRSFCRSLTIFSPFSLGPHIFMASKRPSKTLSLVTVILSCELPEGGKSLPLGEIYAQTRNLLPFDGDSNPKCFNKM